MSKKNPAKQDIRYEVIVQEDPETGDLIVPIPQPILDQLNLKEGEELKLDVGTDGKIYLKRV